jgi:hypothetical protein
MALAFGERHFYLAALLSVVREARLMDPPGRVAEPLPSRSCSAAD